MLRDIFKKTKSLQWRLVFIFVLIIFVLMIFIGTIREFNDIIKFSALATIGAALIFWYILSKNVIAPIVNLMHKARNMALGDFGQILQVKSDDEIGKLTEAFNYMSKELKNTLAKISMEKSKIETILNYMTDGVIAFDINGQVILTNPASVRILGMSEVNKSFNEFSKTYNLGIALEDIVYLNFLAKKEFNINVNDKFVHIYFAVITGEAQKPEGIIAVIQDITRQQKLEDMRKEFVANVSHELRTPLTSIKGYTETLLNGQIDKQTSINFLNVINSEVDRMTRLVRDLLELSRIDTDHAYWNMEQINIIKLVKACIDSMEFEVKNKNQTVEDYVIGEIPSIIADNDKIKQVILNILSNAIKYTPKQGKITVYIGRIFNDVYIKIIDTGIGIPKNDLPRIFERFYRADKARSRELGGTGLGLSIAKQIVELHNGTISINSELGKGTEVTIRLSV